MLWSSVAAAELKYFPMWERLTCSTGEFACYDQPKAELILKVDIDMQQMAAELEAAKTTSEKLMTANKKLHAAVQLEKEQVVRLVVRLKEKHEVLEETTYKLKKAEGRDVLAYVPWIGLGVLVIAGGAFVGGYYLRDRLD